MDKIFLDYKNKTENSYLHAEAENRSTLTTCKYAFGGHISKGLLKRGRSSLNKITQSAEKFGRAKLFLELSSFDNLRSNRITGEQWGEISEIIYKFTFYKDFGDSFDYWQATGWMRGTGNSAVIAVGANWRADLKQWAMGERGRRQSDLERNQRKSGHGPNGSPTPQKERGFWNDEQNDNQ